LFGSGSASLATLMVPLLPGGLPGGVFFAADAAETVIEAITRTRMKARTNDRRPHVLSPSTAGRGNRRCCHFYRGQRLVKLGNWTGRSGP
jgi:hypothetical protein